MPGSTCVQGETYYNLGCTLGEADSWQHSFSLPLSLLTATWRHRQPTSVAGKQAQCSSYMQNTQQPCCQLAQSGSTKMLMWLAQAVQQMQHQHMQAGQESEHAFSSCMSMAFQPGPTGTCLMMPPELSCCMRSGAVCCMRSGAGCHELLTVRVHHSMHALTLGERSTSTMHSAACSLPPPASSQSHDNKTSCLAQLDLRPSAEHCFCMICATDVEFRYNDQVLKLTS